MPKALAALLSALAAVPALAAEERPATPEASEARVIHIDANTQIRFDPRLRALTGTDTAAAGASGSMEERHRQETKAGAAGPDDDVVRTLPPTDEKTKKQKR